MKVALLGSVIAWTVAQARSSDTLEIAALLPIVDSLSTNAATCGSKNGRTWLENEKVCILESVDYTIVRVAAAMATIHFNERNSTFLPDIHNSGCTKRISLSWINSADNIRVAVQGILERITTSKPHIVIGESSSSISMPTALVSSVYDIPQISFRSTSKRLDDTVNYPYFFRTIPTDTAVAFAICKYFVQQGFEYAGIIYQATDYGEAYKEDIVSNCLGMGMKEIKVVPLDDPQEWTEEELSKVELQVEKLGPTGINVYCLITHSNRYHLSKRIFETAFRLDMIGPGTAWFISEATTLPKLEEVDESLRDAIAGTVQVLAAGGEIQNPLWNTFTDYWETFETGSINELLPELTKIPSDYFKQLPKTTKNIANVFTFMYDAVLAGAYLGCQVNTTSLESFASQFWKLKADFSFHGLSGEVKFNSIGNRATETTNFQLLNIIVDGTGYAKSQIGSYNKDAQAWDVDAGILSNGKYTGEIQAIDLPVHDKQQSKILRFLCRLLFGINMAVGAGFFIWTVLNRQNPIVRASQTMFLACIALGGVISSSTIIPLTLDDSGLDDSYYDYSAPEFILDSTFQKGNHSCMAALWLYCVGFHLTFGPLFMKTYRVKKLFEAVSKTFTAPVVVSNCNLWSAIATFMSVDIVIIVVFQALFPFVYKREVLVRDGFGNPMLSAGYCSSEHSTVFFSIIFALHFVQLVFGNILAYQTRYISTAFQESKYVSIALVGNLQVIALGLPVLVIVSGNPESNMLVRSLVLFLNDLTVMVCIFVPKIYLTRYGVGDENSAGAEWVRRHSTKRKLNSGGGANMSGGGAPSIVSTTRMQINPTFVPSPGSNALDSFSKILSNSGGK